SHGGEVAEFAIGKWNIPAHRAIFGVERDEVGVGRFEKKIVPIHSNAALTNVVAFGLAMAVPDLVTITTVDGPNIVWSGEVLDGVAHQGRGFNGAAADAKGPGECQRVDVGRVDLIECAVAAAGVVAIVGRPRVGRLPEERSRIESLSRGLRRSKAHND